MLRSLALIMTLCFSAIASSSYYEELKFDSLRDYALSTAIKDREVISRVLGSDAVSDIEVITGALMKVLVAFEFSDGAYAIEYGFMVLQAWVKYPDLIIDWFEKSPERTARLIAILPVVFFNENNSKSLFSNVLSQVETLKKPDNARNYSRNQFIAKFVGALQKSIR